MHKIKAERRRAHLIEVATKVFLEHGFKEASLSQVVAEAGGSRRAIYEHFDNKEGLFIAAVESLLDRLLVGVGDFSSEPDEIETTLVSAGIALVEGVTSQEALAMFRIVISESKLFPALAVQTYGSGPARAFEVFERYLTQQADTGVLSLSDAHLSAKQLVEMLKGGLQLRALLCPEQLPSRAEIEANVRHAVRDFLKANLADPQRGTVG